MTKNFALALAARTVRETAKNEAAAYSAHRTFVKACVAVAREDGTSVETATRRIVAAHNAAK